jgi:hypothetical protein
MANLVDGKPRQVPQVADSVSIRCKAVIAQHSSSCRSFIAYIVKIYQPEKTGERIMFRRYTILSTLCTLLLFYTVGMAQPTMGLVAYYAFDGNANDGSGNGLDGIVHGATLTSDRFGQVNSAYQFDGVSNYIEVPDNILLDTGAGQSVAICLWVRPESNGGLISKYRSVPPRGGYQMSAFGDSVWFDGRDRDDYRSSGYPHVNLRDGDWHFVVGMRSGSIWSIWVDSVMLSSRDAGSTSAMDNDLPMVIGCGNDVTGNAGFLTGKIDDIRIYNRALTMDEILTLWNDRPSGTENRNGIAMANSIRLSQNYPNPFNPTTTLAWSLPHATNISLVLYDLLGREVALVFNGRCEAGSHSVVFDGSRLASGAYFVQLQAGGQTVATRRVVLMK